MKEQLRLQRLSKRERQILDMIYMLGEATAEQVIASFPEKVGDASIRKLIRIMEEKGYLTHRRRGRCHLYLPTVPKERVSKQALRHLLKTYFFNSAPKAVSALLGIVGSRLSKQDLEELASLIEAAKKKKE